MELLPSVKTDEKYMGRLIEFEVREDIPAEWQNTPIEALIMAQNFGWPIHASGQPEMLISTCIEFRYALPIPRMAAYVVRRPSGLLIGSEFTVGFVLSRGVNCLAMIGHNDCGMAKVDRQMGRIVDALVNQGWGREAATDFVKDRANKYKMTDELDALESEYKRLRSLFRKLIVAPLFVSLYDSKMYLPRWYQDMRCDPQPMTSYRVTDEEIRRLI